MARAERASTTAVGGVAIQHTVDIDTDEVLKKPIVLARSDDGPAELRED